MPRSPGARASKSLRLEESTSRLGSLSFIGTEWNCISILFQIFSSGKIVAFDFSRWREEDGRRQTRREGLRLCRAKHGSRHKGRLNLPPIDFHGLLLLPLRLFFKEISKFGTGIHTRACKSRPCRMQNGTSVASPFFPPTRNRFPAFRKKKKNREGGKKT